MCINKSLLLPTETYNLQIFQIFYISWDILEIVVAEIQSS